MATTKQNNQDEVKALKERVAELEQMLEHDSAKPLNATTPAIVDMGKVKKKKIKALKRGEGELLEDVWDVLHQVNAGLEGDNNDKILVPIVIVYKQNRKRRLEKLFF